MTCVYRTRTYDSNLTWDENFHGEGSANWICACPSGRGHMGENCIDDRRKCSIARKQDKIFASCERMWQERMAKRKETRNDNDCIRTITALFDEDAQENTIIPTRICRQRRPAPPTKGIA